MNSRCPMPTLRLPFAYLWAKVGIQEGVVGSGFVAKMPTLPTFGQTLARTGGRTHAPAHAREGLGWGSRSARSAVSPQVLTRHALRALLHRPR